MKKRVVGIDLGTTFSSVAALDRDGKPVAIENAEGETATPSAVYFGDDGAVVGKEALRLIQEDPERGVVHAKRFLGESEGWVIDGVLYSPVDISSLIIRKLKDDAAARLGPIDGAVVTVPAHFNAHKRELTIEAANQAGLKVLDLVNEPVAAALCYVLGDEGEYYAGLAEEQTVLVYDLGGGTFDLSLVNYTTDEVRVLAASGDLKLGGIDWDQRIADRLADLYLAEHGEDLRKNPRMVRKLAVEAEKAKRALSNPRLSKTTVSNHHRKKTVQLTLTREEFEGMTTDLLERTRVITERLLKSAGYHWHRIDRTIAVGGSSRMPMVTNLIREMSRGISTTGFDKDVVFPIPPELSVAHGAALYAGIVVAQGGDVSTSAGKRLAKFRVVNVNSRGLGVLVWSEEGQRVNHTVIPRNTPLPATARVTVGTIKPDQRRVSLRIVQGEGEAEHDTRLVCECVIDDLPPDLPIRSAFDIDLSYESNGLLQVVAQHRNSGLLASAHVSPEDVAAAGTGPTPSPVR